MIVEIDKDYFLESDKYNIVLKKRSIIESGKNKGAETTYDQGYFGDVSRALRKYIHLTLNEDNDTSNVEELLNKLDELQDKIDDIGKDINYKVFNK